MNLPKISFLTDGPMAPERSLDTAAAPARAMAQIGRELFQTGAQGFKVSQQIRETNEARIRATFMAGVEQDRADYDNDLLKNPNFDTWGPGIRERARGWQNDATGAGLSPAGKAILDRQLLDYSTKTVIDVETQAALRKNRDAWQVIGTAHERYAESADREGMQRTRDEAVRMGATSGQLALMDAQGGEKARKAEFTRELGTDPKGALERLKDPKYRESKPPAELMNFEGLARTALQQQTADISLSVYDGIDSNDITTPAEIEKRTQKLRPHAREPLFDYLKRHAAEEQQTLQESPEYQSTTIGEITRRMATYRATSDLFDKEYVGILGQIRTLPQGGIERAHLTQRMEELRSGQLYQKRSSLDRAEKAFDQAFTDGRFGRIDAPATRSMPIPQLLQSGILSDATKLQGRGFSPELSSIIARDNVGADELIAIGFSPADALRGEGPGLEARSFRYLALAARPKVQPDTLDPWNRGAFDAIDTNFKDGTKKSYDYPDAEAEDAAIEARDRAFLAAGKARTRLLEFAFDHPDASESDYQNQIRVIADDEVARLMQEVKFPAYTPGGSDADADADASANAAVPLPGKDLTEIIKHFEAGGAAGGFHARAYWDNKQWSIGYGTRSRAGETITQEEAGRRLDEELARHRARVVDRSERFKLDLAPNQIDALTSFDFNTGLLDQLLAQGTRSHAEIAEKMPLYRNANGRRLPGLERRRRAEARLFRNGYPE